MSRRPLTERQREVLDFVYERTLSQGYQPTLRDIMLRFGWSSTNAAAEVLDALERKGYICRRAGAPSRALVLVDWPDELKTYAYWLAEEEARR